MMYCGAGQARRRPGARPHPRYGQGRAATRLWALRYGRLGGHDTALGARWAERAGVLGEQALAQGRWALGRGRMRAR